MRVKFLKPGVPASGPFVTGVTAGSGSIEPTILEGGECVNFRQDAEKGPPAAFSHRSEAQRTEAYALPLRSLRPCWTAFLIIPVWCYPCYR